MSTPSRPLDTPASLPSGVPDSCSGLHGLAELAFGSLTRADDVAGGQHLALLHAESLELDLSDPAQRQFGDYELLELLGEGGMGVVYRAHHQPLDREVAIKLLSAGPWASKDFIARFEREAQNAARMQHPNIVTVYEAGSHDGLQFMAMRLVEGCSLSAKLKRGEQFTPRQAAETLRTIAEAVGYAHSLGVLHLDLKPGNVLIDADGVPHVADFGLARRFDSAAIVANDEVSGTPSYMAPEQARVRSSRLTAATDVWGFGAILYELLTGQPPFRADTARATLKLVLDGQVRSPRRTCPSLPLDLQAIVLRCLARDPGERYPSARALADDLARFVEGRPVQARPLNAAQRVTRWTRREPRLAAMALLAFALLAGGLFATTQQWFRADRNAATARANEVTANAHLWDSRNDSAQRFMEEGQDWQAAPLLLANLTEMEAAGDVDRAQGARLRLGLVRNRNPVLIDAIPAQTPAVAIAFDASGTRMATSGTETGLLLFDTRNGRQLLTVPGRPHEVWSRLRFIEDGRVLLAQGLELSAQSPRPAGAHMRRLDTATGAWLAPPAPFADVDTQSYSADGRYAVLTLPDGRAQFWSTSPWRALSPLRKLPFSDGETARLIAPDGSFFALNGPEGAVTLVDSRSLSATRIPLGEFGRMMAWAVSPDSRWLALGDAAGHAVVVVDVATRAVRRLEPRPFFGARWLTFSDDGGWLALASREGGVYLWSWPEGRLLAPPFSGNTTPGGAPLAEHVQLDPGRNLVFVTDETANTALWQVAPAAHANDLGLARRVMSGVDSRMSWGVEAAAWHPEAGLIATSVEERVRLTRLRAPVLKAGRGAPLHAGTLRFDGRHLVEVDGRAVRIVDAMTEQPIGDPIEFAQAPTFAELTPDGATLVVASGRAVHVMDVAGRKPRFAPILLDGAPSLVDLSPDSQRIALAWLSSDAPSDRNVSEMVVIHSLVDGRRLGGPEPLPGPTNEVLAFSPDGSRLLIWNPRELALRDGVTLARVSGPLENFRPRGRGEDSHDGYMRLAAFDAANNVELIFGRHDGSRWIHELRRYAADGAFTKVPQRGWSLSLLPLPGGLGTAVASADDPLNQIIAPDGTSRALPDLGDDAHRAALALSPDGRWLVRTRLDGVLLFDLARMARVATLNVALPQPDEVMQLAFSPDGRRLLGRSVRNRYMVWDFAPDERPVEAIAREQGLRDLPYNVVRRGAQTRDLDDAERRALHAADPGAPQAPPVPRPAIAGPVVPGGAILPRDPAAPSVLLDLTPYYTFGLAESFVVGSNARGVFSWLPPGVQRFQGVDYDVRGGVLLTAGVPLAFELGDAVDTREVGALHVLALSGAGDGEHLAQLRLDYVDGTHAVVPVGVDERFGQYWHTAGARASARIAAFGWDARLLRERDRRAFAFTLRVPNPHPERTVKALTLLNPKPGTDAPIVLALTVEPSAAAANVAAAKPHDRKGD